MMAGARLTEALDAAFARAETTRRSAALLVVSVNNLEQIDGELGFGLGEEVLAAVVRLVEDIAAGSVLGFIASNRLAVVLENHDLAAMRGKAGRIIDGVRNARITTSACRVAATVSIGGVIVPDQARTATEAISYAVEALDIARRRHAGFFVAYAANANVESARRTNAVIADTLISALEDDRFRFDLQPIVSVKTGKPALYECLLRTVDRNGTIILPSSIIHVAEELGMAHLVDERTLQLALALLREHARLKLSLNISSLTIGDEDWLATVHRATKGSRHLAERLTVEITETVAIRDFDMTKAFVEALRQMGCRLAIDDFGAGYMSFTTLKLLKAHMLKIDGAFVKDMRTDPGARAFIKTMIDIAKLLGMDTVAEWVSDEETAELAKSAGASHLQGFLHGNPTPAEEIGRALGPIRGN